LRPLRGFPWKRDDFFAEEAKGMEHLLARPGATRLDEIARLGSP
jgi:hypothetical protein